MRARAVEGAHERGLVGVVDQRQRGEVDAGRPALGPRDEQLDVGLGEREPEPPVEELVASATVKRRSSARSSSSWPRARSAASGSAGSTRVESTSWTPAGRWSTNHVMLSRAPWLESR